MPVEVPNLVGDAVMKCQICRRYVRLPNCPQLKLHNAGTFNQCVPADLFMLWDQKFLFMVDEATRYKVAVAVTHEKLKNSNGRCFTIGCVSLEHVLLSSWIKKPA